MLRRFLTKIARTASTVSVVSSRRRSCRAATGPPTWIAICFTVSGIATLLPSAEPRPTPSRVDVSVSVSVLVELVDKLSSPRFIDRQLATEQLCSLGTEAPAKVIAATAAASTESEDPEVRFRAREILRVIRHESRERTVKAFIAGHPVETNHELPGWTLFQSISGENDATRRLYVDVLRDEWGFLDLVFAADRAEVPRLIEDRVRRLDHHARQRKQRVSVASLCAVMLAACREDVVIARPNNIMLLCYRAPDFDAAVRNGENGAALQRLLGNLISRPTATDSLNQSFHFALNYNLKEGLLPARELLMERNGPVYAQQYALLVVGKLGDESDLRLVRSLLDSTDVVSRHHRIEGRRVTTELRDVALAVLIARHRESFAQYGLPNVKLNHVQLLQPTSIGFASDEDRQRAFESWFETHRETAGSARPWPRSDDAVPIPVDLSLILDQKDEPRIEQSVIPK